MKDTVQSIRRSSTRFFSGTLLSRFTGMFRDISMAYAFGTHPSVAAFMVAFRFAHLLRRLFGEGALQSAFIPEFETLRHINEQRAMIFFRDLTAILSLFLALIITIGCGILAAFLWWGNLSADNQEVLFLTFLMLPSLLFICLFGLNASFLQCEKSYFMPSVAPVAFNAIWIIAVFFSKSLSGKDAMPWLSIGVVIACMCQWLITFPQIYRKIKSTLPSFWSFFSSSSPDLYRLGKPLALGILGVAASQINNAVDSLFARFAEPEGPAFLWYAIRIQQLPLALFGIAIAGAILPPLSRAIKAGQTDTYHQFLQDALYQTWIFILPMTAALFIVGDLSVSFLYGRGDFDLESAKQTTYCLWAYGIGLLPSALILVLAPASYAKNNYLLPSIASFATMLLNLILNTLCIIYFHWGAVSVAVATSISAFINIVFLGWNLFKSGTSLFSIALIQKALPFTISSGIAFFGTFFFRLHILELSFFSQSFFSSSIPTQLLMLIYPSFFFAFLFILSLLIQNHFILRFKSNEIKET